MILILKQKVCTELSDMTMILGENLKAIMTTILAFTQVK